MPELTDEEKQQLRGSLQTLRIIVAALILGLSAFTGYALYSHLGAGNPPKQPAVAAGQLTLPQAIAMAAAAVAGVLALLVPPFIPIPPLETAPTDPRQAAILSAVQAIQVRTIVACALLEGAGYFNAFYVQTDFSRGNLAMVVALLFVMVSYFPLSGFYFGKVERLMSV